ncbi:WecB/TagA/CpsF family glycosyltransferase [uncultured Thioclava sp.]|uniref:WecB/TagA/CpsF family glycosyltransferase n=1 Tax=Thioclava arctica TaxID=3238301 RepID=A0ABV3TH32_9RHOB|nr:WecB/TagA/CpsF family glycosyltransferase [uncultured Thioclava sp.]
MTLRSESLQDQTWDATPIDVPLNEGMAARHAAPVQPLGTTNVLGVAVSALNMDQAVSLVQDAVRTRRRGYICVAGAHGLVECQTDPSLRDAYNAAMAVTPDGMPLVWALHGDGHDSAGRVYGPDLMRLLFAKGVSSGMRHFLYGTTPESLERLSVALQSQYPGAEIVGVHAPPFRPLSAQEEREVSAVINAVKPDVVWVGLSAPKQERWMAAMRDKLEAPVLIGVGAAFDFIGGNKRSAPAFLQRAGLEWAFRLMTEPRRLWRRYAKCVPAYIWLRFLQKTGLRAFPIVPAIDVSNSGRSQS